MRVSQLIISLGLCVPVVGFADQPPPAPTITESAATTATAATDSQTDAAVEKTPAQLKKEAAEAKIRQSGINGYKPQKTKSGDTVYCKTEASLGSHFETKQCRSYEQLRVEALQGKEFLENAQHVVPPPAK